MREVAGPLRPNPSPGPRPPTRSSNASPHIFNGSLAQDTRCESGEPIGDTKRRFVLVGTLRESLQDNEIHPMSDWGSSGRRFKWAPPKFAYTSPIGFSRAAEIHGPTASQLPGLASCPAIADPTRDIHRREQPRAIPGEQVPLGNDPLA